MKNDLKKYDGLCVRIIDSNGDAFDGICYHNSEEYDEHEYGKSEESLQIENFLFFERDIKEIQILEDKSGPYGRFFDPYGKLEIMTVEDGIDSIEDILFSEEDEHVIRLLNCLEEYLDHDSGLTASDREAISETLRKLMEASNNTTIQEKAWKILNSQ